jgi:hypothetical protein
MQHRAYNDDGQTFFTTVNYGGEDLHVECIIIPPFKGFNSHIDSPAYLDPGTPAEVKDMHVYRQWSDHDEDVTDDYSPRSLGIIEANVLDQWKLDMTVERAVEVRT